VRHPKSLSTSACLWVPLFALVAQSVRLEARSQGPLVFVLAGQSNMVGQGATDEIAPDDAVLPPNVTYFLGPVETTPAEHPRFGPEVALARDLAAVLPDREIVLVKHARGGTSLLAWAPQWDSARAEITRNASAGPLYSQLMDVLQGLDLGPDAELGAILWMQGERDARTPEAGEEYFANVTELIAAFRRDLARPDLPFLLGHVNPPAERYPAREAVREAQKRAAREISGVHLIATDDLTKWDDDLHYDTEGILELGHRFAAAALEVISGR
jgi:hypothetical protein